MPRNEQQQPPPRRSARAGGHEQAGIAEAKAVGREILQLGARYLRAGLAWLNHGRNDMTNERYRDDRGDWRERGGDEARQQQARWREDEDREPLRSGGPEDPGARARRRGRDDEAGFERRTGYAQRGYDDGWDQGEREDTAGGRSLRGMPIAGGVGLGRGGYAGNYQSGEAAPGGGGRGGDEYDTQFGRYPEPRWGDRNRGQGRYGSAPAGGLSRREGGRGYRGRGPQGYARSDARIAEDVNERLMEDDDIDATDIVVAVRDGIVTLTGSVDERWVKHRAEDLADACSGVKDVENRLRVRGRASRGDDSPPAGAAGSDSSAT